MKRKPKKPTAKQKSEILALTKEVNKLKVRRNRLVLGSSTHKTVCVMIKALEKELKEKRTKWGI